MQTYRGPFDVINQVVRTEGLRGLYRGFGITMLTQSPASALWWSSYGGAQHAIWRCAIYYTSFLCVQCFLLLYLVDILAIPI